MYNDEYDDTYDSTDIKLAGTVELHMLDESENAVDAPVPNRIESIVDAIEDPAAAFEAELVMLVESGQGTLLEASARKSAARATLKRKTQLSDEQLEGWYKMFLRDVSFDYVVLRHFTVVTYSFLQPRRQRKLREKYEWRGNKAAPSAKAKSGNATTSSSDADGVKSAISERSLRPKPDSRQVPSNKASTATAEVNHSGSEKEESGDDSQQSRQRGDQGGRGGSRGGRGGNRGGGRGGGPRKYANHGRKDGHSKKMQRGMGGPE
jgi:uncharacterized membrane protein YgcG